DGDDVLVTLAIDLVDHRRKRRRLSRTGGAGDQDEAARLVADLLHDRRETELPKSEDLVGDLPVNGGRGAALVEDVCAEAGQPFDTEGKIELEVLLKAVFLGIGEH